MDYANRWVIFVCDLIISVFVTLLITLIVSHYGKVTDVSGFLMQSGLYSFVASAISILVFRLYINVLRHFELRDVWRIIMVALLKVSFIFIVYQMFLSRWSIEVLFCFVLADFFVTIFLLVFFRVIVLSLYHLLLRSVNRKLKPIWVYGITDSSVALAQGGSNVFMVNYQIKGFIIGSNNTSNIRIVGYPIYKIEDEQDFLRFVAFHHVEGVLFPNIQSAKEQQNRLMRYCEKRNLSVLVVPNIEEVKNGRINYSIRPVKIEDLLGREEIKINLKEIGNLLENKIVMVTGAAGSIGSEICRQLARFNIRQLICFDMSETAMHNLRLELEEKFPELDFMPVIGDVRSEARVDYVFRTYLPQVVFHAAAYKHVPLMEENPCEAVRVNVYGTRNMADYSVKYNVERFVMISTDKAVNPTNIMGCSKRIAEIYVQSLSLAIVRGEVNGSTKFITTRFGNVLGSNGSVIPRFRDQIKAGGPITVTHPDIIRYFMTIPEACRLVLEAGTIGKGGEIFVFEMGRPVKIAELARRMIELSGLCPETDIKIVYTGLRPGEKLYEELLSNKENTLPTPHEEIRVASVREYDYKAILPHIELLTKLSFEVRIMEMVKEMKDLVVEFKSQNSIFEEMDKKQKF